MSSSPIPILAIRHITKSFPGVVALKDVSLEIKSGELHSICGENGAGKSTLMKILAGIYPQFDGEYLLKGNAVHFHTTRDAQHAGVAIIHQELNLVEQLSAAANIFLGREKRSAYGLIDNTAMESAAAALLEQLECRIQPDQPVGSLRVGDQQLIEIAKALSLDAEILIMDEPTSALTESEVARLFRIIERLRQRGVTILYISHKMDEIFHLSDRITILRDGQLVKTVDKSATTPKEVTHLMVGRAIEEARFAASRSPGDVVLEIKNLSLPWPGHARGWRLKDINFSLRRGEILGIAGLMGAGRTELLECLFGASPHLPSGCIMLDGESVLFRHPAEAHRAGVALVTEDRKRLGIFSQMNVCQNMSLCTLNKVATAGVVGAAREKAMVDQSVARLGVKTAGIDAGITTLSGGNQQKTIIGRWLLAQPKVLLLDDPTRGIDVGAKAELYQVMDRLCRDGLAIVVTSSELPELLTVCDRILVLCEGRLTGEFSRAEATEQKIMEAATNREV